MYNQRGAVERSFKKIKDPTQEDLKGKPQRIRGRAATQLFRAFYWVSVNDRSLAKFNKDRADERAELERKKTEPKTRKPRREVTLETMRKDAVDARAGPKAA